MTAVRIKVLAYISNSKEPFRTTEIMNRKDYEIENTTDEVSSFISDVWDEAQDEEDL